MPPEPDVRPVNNWSHDISDPQIRTLDEWRSKSAEHGVTLNAFRIDNGSDVYVRNPRNGNTVAIKPDGSIARLNADANAHIDNLDYANRLEPVRHNDDVRVEMEQKARHEAAIAESRRIEDGYYQGRAPSDPQWKREDGKWYRLDGESKWVRHIAKKGLPSSVELERDRKIGNLKRIRGLDEEPQMARPESDAVDPLNDTTPTEPEVKAYESASPAESSPAESSPAESYPAESYPVESSPVESSPVESSPAVTVEKQSIPVVDRSKKNYKEANGKHVSISKTITQSGKKNVDVILYDPDTRDVTPGFQIRRGRDDNGWAVVSKGDWVTDSLGRSKQEEVTEARFEDLKAAKAYAVSRLNGEIRNPSDTIRHEPYTPKKRGLSGISDPVETEDGFLSDGAMAVIPKTMPESTNKFSVNILDHLGISDDLTPIESVSQYSHPESPTEYVHVVSEGKHSFYNRLYVDRVMTEHPDANPSVFRKTKKDEWTLIFTDKSGKIVGVVMPMIIEKRSGIYKGAVSRSKGTPKDDSTLSFSIKPPDGKDPGIDVVMAKDRANDPDLQFSLNTLKEWEDVHRRERIKRDIDPDTVVEHVEKIGRLGRILNERPDLLEEEGTGNPIRKNIEYGKSGDLNTNCQRRFEYKADIERIEKKLERLMTPDEMFGLSALLKSQGKLAPCVYCYVEGARRQWNGVMHAYEQRRADAFAYMDKNGKPTVEDLGQAIIEKWDKKAGIKILKDLIDEWFESTSNGEKPYHFTTRLIADSEFRTSEFERDPRSVEVYKTAVKYATVRSLANTPKPFDPYRGQFFAVKGKARHLQSIRAGWRFFSTTDAQVNHIPDLMQMVVDLALMGDKAHAYTKEPWFVNVFGETGMKINMSIFAEGGLNGEPIREPVAGNNGMAWSEARALRDKFDNAGTIFVATNDAQIRWALDQSWIDMIIPWHRSGISEAQGKALGYTDYSGVQHEKWIDGSNKGKPPKIFENQHKNDLATYRRILEEKGLRPKFEDFYDHPNYMKLVIDATRPEIEQKPVKPNFDYKYAEQTIRDWQKAGGYSLAQAGSQEIVDAMLAKIRNKEPMFSQKSILPEETKALEGMVASDLEAGLKDTARSWESALPGGFNIVQSESELPSNYRGRIMSYGQESRVEAFYDPKTKSVWMIADNISDIDRAKSRAIHEVIGHHGVDTILKKGGDRFFNDLFVAKNKEILDYIEKNRSDIDPNANRVQAAKEWFADEIAAGRHQSKGLVGWWNRFVRLFNEGLRKFGFDMKLADSEISDIATRAWQYVEERSMPFGMELSSGPEMGKIRGDVDLQTSLATDRASKAERPEPGAPASKLTENSLVNGITMGQVENLILSGNKGIRDELRNILNARVETEGSDGRNTFQDWMNPAKVGSRIYAELLKNGMSGKEARTHLSDLMKDYETKYNEVLGKEPDLQFSINAQSIKDKAKEAVNNLDERLMKPDRLGTEKFYQETVKPVLGNSVSGFKDLVTRMTHAVVPRKGVPQDFLDSAMKMLGTREKTDFIIESTLNKMEEMMWTKDREASGKSTDDLSAKIASAVTGKKVMDTLSREEQIAFVDRIKRGEKQPNEDLQAVADFMRKMEDYWYGEARRLNPSLKWKQNHYRVLWKVIPGSMEDGFGGLFRKPLPGSKGFTKQSTLVDMSDGIAKGGVPYSYNPVTMWRVAMEDLTKYVTANRMMEEGKDLGYFKFVREFSKPPEGFVKVDDPMFRVYFQPKMTQKEMAEKGITDTKDARKGMITKAGEWYAEPNAARLLNNYISRDLIREVPAGRALMALKNITTAVELGLSAFHFVFETLDTVGSAVGLGLDKMWNRGVLKGDSTATVEGFRDIIRAPITPITYAKIGGRAIKYLSEKAEFMKTKEGKWFLEKVPDAEMFLDDMFNAGGRLAMAQDYKINSIGTFRQNLKANNYIGTTMRLIPALSEAMMKPLFETYIPRLKVGMFLTEYANALAKNSEKIGTGKFTRGQVARKLWDSVENRLGEMNFDTLFWNRTFKSAMQLMTRSVTWKLGNFRSMGGAFLGQAAELVAAIKDRRPPELQSNMAWLLGMSAVTATIGTIIQQMATGKPPKDLKDLIYPQIDPNDPDVRISLPTYWKDLVHAKHDPVKYVKSSASGWIGKMAEIWDNKDFYGVEVVHKDDPVPLKTWDALKHMVPLPFSVQGFMQMKEKHEPAHKMVSGFLGFGQAPKYISKTPAETLMDEMLQAKMPVGTRTAHEFEKTRMIQSIRRDLRSGNNAEADRTIQEGILNGKLTKRDLVNLYRSGNELPIATRFRHLNIDESLKVWEAADADERKILRPILFKKGGNIKNAEPEHRDDLRDRFRKAMEG
jgi:hypothetical protein